MACVEWIDTWPRPIENYEACLNAIYRGQLLEQIDTNLCDPDSPDPLRIWQCRDFLNALATPALLASPGLTEYVSRSCQYPGSEVYGRICDRYEKEYVGRSPEYWPILARQEFGAFPNTYMITFEGGPLTYCSGQDARDAWRAAQRNPTCAITFDPKPCQQVGCDPGLVCGGNGTCFVTAPVVPPADPKFGYTTQQLVAWILQWVFGLTLVVALLILGRGWQKTNPKLDLSMLLLTVICAIGLVACIAAYYW